MTSYVRICLLEVKLSVVIGEQSIDKLIAQCRLRDCLEVYPCVLLLLHILVIKVPAVSRFICSIFMIFTLESMTCKLLHI